LAPGFIGSMATISALFMAVVALVLLIACSNIAILLLARSAARKREFGIRLALGASRGQLVRQLLAESSVLAVVGGVGAAALAFVTARLLTQIYLPVPMPIALEFDFDWRVVTFAAIASLASTLLFALGPALQSAKTDVVSWLKTGQGHTGPQGARGRFGLVAAQVAMSTVLLITAATLIQSLSALKTADRRFSTDHILMVTLSLSTADYTRERGTAFLERALNVVERKEGVICATFADNVPLTHNSLLLPATLQREPAVRETTRDRAFQVYINRVSQGHFRTLNIPLLEGRDFTALDTTESIAVGIANQSLASRFWPGESPIGRRLFSTDGSGIEIIGLAADSKYESLDEPPKALLYRPLAQSYVPTVTLLVKTAGDPSLAAPFVRKELSELDPNLLTYNLNTLESRVGLNLLPNRAAAIVAGILGT
jgi:predicted permease